MKEISISELAGTFAENKDVAKKIREGTLLPSLMKGEEVIIDFKDVESATQSFIHALISDLIRRYGSGVLDKLIFRNCNNNVQKIIIMVSDYMQESEA
ncbi:MAG: STAS-like domain-containing protein [Candidatus Thermoplasmatota archaeon]|jgi:hypothetical protein|nr:STAS-like domain-containing protein [Candidatus Thermoplasmatota archaeon]